MKFHSFDEFKQVRQKAAQWRAFEKQLDTLGDIEREVVREVLLVDTIDNRTDRDYEKRLYDGYKTAMERLSAGLPLMEETKSEDDEYEIVRRRQKKFEEALQFVGITPPGTPTPSQNPSTPRSLSPYSPPSTPLLTPSPPRAETPQFSYDNANLFGSPSSQETVILNSPKPKKSINKQANRLGIKTKTRRRKAVFDGNQKKSEIRPKPTVTRQKRRPQKKFDLETLEAVRPFPPRTRRSAK